ncbi:MAG: type II secretion system protein [Ideonella sp.]|nr:type II secretion system protein [Ideonella sp.]
MRRADSVRVRGFTLIELIVVIVILGVLAATALPKFVSMKAEAAQAALDGLRGSVASAMNLARTKCLLTTGCNGGFAMQFNHEGFPRRFVHGYPDAGDATANDIGSWLTLSDVTVTNAGGRTRFQLNSASTPSTCYVEYAEAAAWGAVPTITSVATGC